MEIGQKIGTQFLENLNKLPILPEFLPEIFSVHLEDWIVPRYAYSFPFGTR